jgi:hypothetical protein
MGYIKCLDDDEDENLLLGLARDLLTSIQNMIGVVSLENLFTALLGIENIFIP